MSDISRDRLELADEDRLPWLEPVENEDDEPGVGAGRLVAAVIAGLIALGLVIGGVFWLRERTQRTGAAGEGELIAAPAGDYKTKPEAPGGMQVEGTGDLSYGASEGADVNSSLDLSALPEAPVTEPAPPPAAPVPRPVVAAPKPAPVPVVAATAKPKVVAKAETPRPTPAAEPAAPEGPGGTIQLGAFSSQSKANGVWKSLSGRFSFLGALSSSVTPVESGGNTLYRLRANGPDAGKACAKLKVAGESCVVLN